MMKKIGIVLLVLVLMGISAVGAAYVATEIAIDSARENKALDFITTKPMDGVYTAEEGRAVIQISNDVIIMYYDNDVMWIGRFMPNPSPNQKNIFLMTVVNSIMTKRQEAPSLFPLFKKGRNIVLGEDAGGAEFERVEPGTVTTSIGTLY